MIQEDKLKLTKEHIYGECSYCGHSLSVHKSIGTKVSCQHKDSELFQCGCVI